MGLADIFAHLLELAGRHLAFALPVDITGIVVADDRHNGSRNALPQVFKITVEEDEAVGLGGNRLARVTPREVEQDGTFLHLAVFLVAEKRLILLQLLFQDGIHRLAVGLAVHHKIERAVATRINLAAVLLYAFNQRLEIHLVERDVGIGSHRVVRDIQLAIDEPQVCLHAVEPQGKGIKQRVLARIVIVGKSIVVNILCAERAGQQTHH